MSQLEGLAEFKRKLKEGIESVKRAAAAGIYAEGNNIISDAMDGCPVDTGTAKRSHYCTLPEEDASGVLLCEIGAGGAAEKYIEKVHETHKTKSKWFQNAYNRAQGDYMQNVFAVAKQVFEQGGNVEQTSIPIDPWVGGKD